MEDRQKEIPTLYYSPVKCPVCNSFGTLKYGTIKCHACKGRGYVIIDNRNGMPVDESVTGEIDRKTDGKNEN